MIKKNDTLDALIYNGLCSKFKIPLTCEKDFLQVWVTLVYCYYLTVACLGGLTTLIAYCL